MKAIAKQSNKKAAFTIVELLTVMSIIIILMGLLAPGMNRVRRYARKVKQKNQFHSIDVALELFRTEFEGYPDSGAFDKATPPQPYCGAMKLCEAMLGQDLLGFHPDSHFKRDGTDGAGNPLYIPATLKARRGVYLKLEEANAYKLKDLFPGIGLPYFDPEKFVLCDVYTNVPNLQTGRRVGMPVLYYKANTSRTAHDLLNPDNPQNIYDYKDNHALVELDIPWELGTEHPLFKDPKIFYQMTVNEKITTTDRPCRADSFILISAGFDGEYGTPDDVFNFGE